MTPTASSSDTVTPPAFDITGHELHHPTFLSDPYPFFAKWRQEAPLARVVWPGPTGEYSRWVFRHADVRRILDDSVGFVKRAPAPVTPPSGLGAFMGRLPNGVFSSDPPHHTKLREAVEGPFRDALVNAPAIASRLSNDVLTGILATRSRRMELMSEYAIKVPSGALFAVMGIPQDHWPALTGMVVNIVRGHDTMQSAEVQILAGGAGMALTAYLQLLLREMESTGDSTLIGRMIQGVRAAGLADIDLQMTLRDFIVAGFLSTTFLIGTGMINLLQHPDQLALLQSGAVPMSVAVNEMLRHDAPAQIVDRIVAEPVEVGGVSLQAGERLRVVIGSANRDETVFADPDRFDITRTDGRASIPFGAGIHHCIGAPLVALVAPIAFTALIERMPNAALAGWIQWQTNPYLRSPVNVPLSF